MEPDSCHFLKQIKAKLISIKPPHRPDPQMFALENGNAQVISNLQREKLKVNQRWSKRVLVLISIAKLKLENYLKA